MVVRFILILAFTLPGASVLSQLNQESQVRVQWKMLPILKGTDRHGMLRSTTCGVYNNEVDREAGTLSMEIDCRSEDHKFRSGFVQDRSVVRIVRDDHTYAYPHRELYGYRDCNGNEYHFFDGKRYELLNPGEAISVYRIFEWQGKLRTVRFFFRKESSDNILPLTLQNLHGEFAGEPGFLRSLHLLARNDFRLVKYHYAINRVRMNALHGTAHDRPHL